MLPFCVDGFAGSAAAAYSFFVLRRTGRYYDRPDDDHQPDSRAYKGQIETHERDTQRPKRDAQLREPWTTRELLLPLVCGFR